MLAPPGHGIKAPAHTRDSHLGASRFEAEVDAHPADVAAGRRVEEVRREGLLRPRRPDDGLALRAWLEAHGAHLPLGAVRRDDAHLPCRLDVAGPPDVAVRVPDVQGAVHGQAGDDERTRASGPTAHDVELDDPPQGGGTRSPAATNQRIEESDEAVPRAPDEPPGGRAAIYRHRARRPDRAVNRPSAALRESTARGSSAAAISDDDSAAAIRAASPSRTSFARAVAQSSPSRPEAFASPTRARPRRPVDAA